MKSNNDRKEYNDSPVDIRVLLGDIWRGIIKFGWIAVALAVILAGIQFYRSYVNFVPTYNVSATFTVHTENRVLTGDNGIAAYSYYYDRETADQLATVFPHIIGNKIVKTRVCEDLGVESMPASVTAVCVAGTNMITLTASGTDPDLTYKTLYSVIENYPSVSDYIIGRTKLVMINEPVVPSKPANSGAWVSSVISAAIIGLALGLAWIMIYAFFRKTIRTKDDIRTVLNQRCIAVLPQVVFKKYRREIDRRILLTNPLVGSEFSDSLRLLRSSVQALLGNGKKTVLITSTAPSEGKTVVSVNLASIFAKDEKKVLLMDLDLRDSGIKELLDGENIEKTKKEDNKFYRIESIDSLGFDVFTFKSRAENVQKVMRTDEIVRKFPAIKEAYDLIFIDTPPCGVISDASVIAQSVDSILYVIREDAVMQTAIRAGISSMLETDAEFLGCVLNGAAGGLGGYSGYYSYGGYYNRYRYGYSYGYGRSYGYNGKRKKKK